MATPTYDLLESVTLTTAASSVTFSSIDGGYGDLVIVADWGFGGQGNLDIRLNSDTSNHSFVTMANTTSGRASAVGADGNYIPVSYHAFANPGTYPSAIINFLDYSATDKHKSVLVRSGNRASGIEAISGTYASTSAVTTIRLFSSPNIIIGSTFNLYGIAKESA